MKRADIVGGLVAVSFGTFAITQAAQLEYWSRFGPGPGFVPLWSSIVIVFGGLLLLLQGIRRQAAVAVGPITREKKKRLLTVAWVAALTVAAAFLMQYMGFSVAMFVLMAVMVGASGKHRWYTTLLTAVLVSGAFYFLFEKLLEVPLPKGFFGF